METVFLIAQGLGFFVMFIVGAILLALITGKGKSKIWEYESEGYCELSLDHKIDVEFHNWKKIGKDVSVTCKLPDNLQTKPVTVLLNGLKVVEFSGGFDASDKGVLTQAVEFPEPKAGDHVIVKLGADEIYSSRLICDFKKN